MAKADVVKQGQDQLVQAQADFLGSFYDMVVADQPAAATPAPAPVSDDVQAEIDAALAPVKAQLDDVQKKLNDETQLEAADQAVIAAKQAVIDQVKAILTGGSVAATPAQ